MAPRTVVDRLRPGDHTCWVFDDEQERLAAMARYAQAGLDGREKVLYFTDRTRPPALLAGLEAHGADATGHIPAGQFRFATADNSYLTNGTFNPESMINGWVREIAAARSEGWAGLPP